MRSKLIVLAVLSFGSVTMARPSTWLMTCQEAQDFVKDDPGIVMNYKYSAAAGNLYKKYFPQPGVCRPKRNGLPFKTATVKTIDEAKCKIGYTCENGNYGEYNPNLHL